MDKIEECLARAREYQAQNNIPEAIKAYKQVIQLDGTNIEAKQALVDILQKAQDYQSLVFAYLDLAETYEGYGQLNEAMQVYTELISLKNNVEKKVFLLNKQKASQIIANLESALTNVMPVIYRNMGRINFTKSEIESAMECLRKSVELNPNDYQSHFILGQAYMAKNLAQEAQGEFQEVIRIAPSEAAYSYEMLGELFARIGKDAQNIVAWFLNAGELHINNARIVDAVRVYERIIEFDPYNKQILEKIGELYEKLQYADKAIDTYKKLSEIYVRDGLLDRVIILYEKILEWNPDDTFYRNKLVEIYRRILSQDPGNLSARTKLIGNLLKLGHIQDVIPDFLELSKSYLEKGMLDDALLVVNKIIELVPDHAASRELLADIYHKKDNKEDALSEYIKVIELLRDKSQLNELERLNSRLNELFPGRYEILLQQAKSSLKVGRAEDALEFIKQVLETEPNNVAILVCYSEILNALNMKEEVERVYQLIMELDPAQIKIKEESLRFYIKQNKLQDAYSEALSFGNILKDRNQDEKSLELYKYIQLYFPQDLEIRRRIAELLFKMDQKENAIAELLNIFHAGLRQNLNEFVYNIGLTLLEYLPSDLRLIRKMGTLALMLNLKEEAMAQLRYLVELYIQKNLINMAVQILQEILEIEPENFECREKIIDLLKNSGNDADITSHYLMQMRFFIRQNNIFEAHNTADIILKNDSDINNKKVISSIFIEEACEEGAQKYLEDLISFYQSNNEYEKCIDIYEELVMAYQKQENLDKFWSAKEKIAEIYYKLNLKEKALEEYQKIFCWNLRNKDWQKTDSLKIEILKILEEQGKIETTVNLLNNILKLLSEENNLEGVLYIIEILEQLYTKDNVSDRSDKLIELITKKIEVAKQLKWHAILSTSYKDLKEIYIKQENLSLAYVQIYNLIELAASKGDIKEAEAYYKEIKVLNTNDNEIDFKFAEILFNEGYFERAKAFYQTIVEQFPDNYFAFSRLALINLLAFSTDEAVVIAKKIITKGYLEEIILTFKKMLEKDAKPKPFISLKMAEFFHKLGFITDALNNYYLAMADKEYYLSANNLVSDCFVFINKFDLAVKQLQYALKTPGYSDEDLLDIRYKLAQILKDTGNYQEAILHYQECYAVDIHFKDVLQTIEELNKMLAQKDS